MRNLVLSALFISGIPVLAQAKGTPAVVVNVLVYVVLGAILVIMAKGILEMAGLTKSQRERRKASEEAQASAQDAVQDVTKRMQQQQSEDPHRLLPRLEALLKVLCPSGQGRLKEVWRNYLDARLAASLSYQTLGSGYLNPFESQMPPRFYETIVMWCGKVASKIEAATEAYANFEASLVTEERRVLYLEETLKELNFEFSQIRSQLGNGEAGKTAVVFANAEALLGEADQAFQGGDKSTTLAKVQQAVELARKVRASLEEDRIKREEAEKWTEEARTLMERVRKQLAEFADCGDRAREFFEGAEKMWILFETAVSAEDRDRLSGAVCVQAYAALSAARSFNNLPPLPA